MNQGMTAQQERNWRGPQPRVETKKTIQVHLVNGSVWPVAVPLDFSLRDWEDHGFLHTPSGSFPSTQIVQIVDAS